MSNLAKKIKMASQFTNKHKLQVLFIFIAFCFVLLVTISVMIVKNYSDTQNILTQSIEDRMISLAMAARESIDPAKFDSYNSEQDILGDPNYQNELDQLKLLANKLGVKYIYAVKQVGDKYYFIYDTDPEDFEYFDEYESIPETTKEAFLGNNTATAYDSDDDYGSFSTGAVPLYYNGRVVGVVAADNDDTLVEKNRNTQFANMALMIAVIAATLVIMSVLLYNMLRRIKKLSDSLYRQAHYDKLTDLPNRQYLFEQLAQISGSVNSYALFFIDLDNFKSVNDTAGHDAGDALLKHIAEYLHEAQKDATVFRPSSGSLNVAARIGGDEFIIIAPDVTADEAGKFAAGLIDGLQTKVNDRNIDKFGVGFSIGVAMYPENSENYHVLIKYADIAMYHAKKSGKNRFLLYRDDMKDKEEK